MSQPDSPPCAGLIADLLRAADPALFLHRAAARLQQPRCADKLADALKQEADHCLRTDLDRARGLAQLLYDLADLVQNSAYRALGLRVRGNIAMIGEYDCLTAVAHYEAAAAIYASAGQPVAAAQSLVGKVGCLYLLGQYDAAIEVGETARQTLSRHAAWRSLTGLLLNLATIYRRLGQGNRALTLLDEAGRICRQTGAAAELPGIALNRANVLCDMGRLQAALEAGQHAAAMFGERAQQVGVARAQMSQGITCYHLGRYNDALALFDEARALYLADERDTDALLVDRFASDLLLQLGRYAEVIAKCAGLRARYQARQIPYEVAQAILNEAVAYAGLDQPEKALASLAEARALLAGNPARTAVIDLEKAAIFYRQQRYRKSLETAVSCRLVFAEHQFPIQAARADLIAAQAFFSLGRMEQAQSRCRRALTVAGKEGVPWLGTRAHHLLARIAQADGRLAEAIASYDHALAELETLRGHLMVELRADFLLDKQQVYEDTVAAYLEGGEPQPALETAERAKSRALTELLAHELDLQITPRNPADRDLLGKLEALRSRRNQLYRQWQTGQDAETQAETRTRLLALEKEISDGWQRLLIRNADYARDASLFQGYTDLFPLPLASRTLLIEYFIVQGELIVFLVSREQVMVRTLPGVLKNLVQPARLLNLNLKAATTLPLPHPPHLETAAQKYLQQLYRALITPVADALADYRHLIVVPHGALLHYLPFAALHDGRRYLGEQYAISYLPNAGLLHYLPQAAAAAGKTVAFGFSAAGRLPHAAREARAIARLSSGDLYLEEAATIAQFQSVAPQASILHLATHADFNRERPLFSGLQLADGQLTTLDLFQLRLNASLVTLSACQTGRSVVSGGDELLGLMRAFLYAGAASLLLTHWRVQDKPTLAFMQRFYRSLLAGEDRAAALRQAQLSMIYGEEDMRHPACWAAFLLVGAAGPLV